jgi:hypothetical protein
MACGRCGRSPLARSLLLRLGAASNAPLRSVLVSRPMADLLLIALEAVVLEHRRCGDLESGVESDQAWIACSCGAKMSHPIQPGGSFGAGR